MAKTYSDLLRRCLPLPVALAGEESRLRDMAANLDGEGDPPGLLAPATLWLRQLQTGCGSAPRLAPMKALLAAMEQRVMGRDATQDLVECDRLLSLSPR